ncbi:MAG: FHA domain-containing protein [bacterium]
MSDVLRTCPSCRTPRDAGDSFCSHCNAELPPVDPSPPAVDPDTAGSRPTIGGEGISEPAVVEECSDPQPVPEIPRRREDPRKEDPVAPVLSPAMPSHCPDLKILYDTGRVFVEGLYVPFHFKVTPRNEEITGLFIEIRRDREVIAREEPDELLTPGDEVQLYLGYTPPRGLGGHVDFKLYVGYKLGDEQRYFLARKRHTVFRAKEKVRSVIENLRIDLHNNLSGGHASENTVNQHLDGLEELCPKANDPAEEIKFIDLPALWEELVLHRSKYSSIGRPGHGCEGLRLAQPPPEAVHARLTLSWRGRHIHLLSDRAVQLGRNRQCDIVTRMGSAKSEANDPISRLHCRIENMGDRCYVLDKGPEQGSHSAMGTYLNGRRVKEGGSAELPQSRAFTVSLASPSVNDPSVFSLEGNVVLSGEHGAEQPACRDEGTPGHPACLVLRRSADSPEVFLLLWKHVHLKVVDPEFGSACICRRSGGFVLSQGGACEWLAPGTSVSAPAGEIRVREYKQKDL